MVVVVQLFGRGQLEEAGCGCGLQSCGGDGPGGGWPVPQVVGVQMLGVDQLLLSRCQHWREGGERAGLSQPHAL